jgi:hypothetical protein
MQEVQRFKAVIVLFVRLMRSLVLGEACVLSPWVRKSGVSCLKQERKDKREMI